LLIRRRTSRSLTRTVRHRSPMRARARCACARLAAADLKRVIDVKGRVELQRRVVEQLHMVEADAGEAEAALNALLDDEASKLRILDHLQKWLGDNLEEKPANRT
jgi:hypothetical protein